MNLNWIISSKPFLKLLLLSVHCTLCFFLNFSITCLETWLYISYIISLICGIWSELQHLHSYIYSQLQSAQTVKHIQNQTAFEHQVLFLIPSSLCVSSLFGKLKISAAPESSKSFKISSTIIVGQLCVQGISNGDIFTWKICCIYAYRGIYKGNIFVYMRNM